MTSSIRAVLVSVLLASSSPGVVSWSVNSNVNNNNVNVDRRTAIQQAGVAAAALGTMTAGGLVIPNAQAIDTINPIATLSDGSKFPLASFGLQ
jgi:hypothetical protein